MTQILYGKSFAEQIRQEVAGGVDEIVSAGGRRPGLSVVLVGENPASEIYVRSKTRASEQVGIVGRTLTRPADISERELLDLIDELNQDGNVDGILVQLPLPDAIDEKRVLERVSPDKDVDGFHPTSVGRLWLDERGFAPATPSGILEMLTRSEVALEGKHAVIVGRSTIVGKPMGALLLRQNCTVTFCHSRTKDLESVCRQGDILVAAIGRAGFFGADHVKEGAVVIDVGINRISDPEQVEHLYPGDEKRRAQLDSKGYVVVGDVDFTRVTPKAAAITPVPGGVGPLTVAMVLANTLEAARMRQDVGR